jgi:hypothetical protein
MIIQSSQWHSFRTIFAAPGATTDYDGNKAWPLALMRANGFNDGIFGMTRAASLVIPIHEWRLQVPFRFGIANYSGNPSAPFTPDAVPGVDEYDWWVSQRTSVDADMFLSVSQAQPDVGAPPGATYSGAIRLDATPRFYADMGLLTENLSDPGEGSLAGRNGRILFKNVHVYCRRRSDGAIQWANVYEESLLD